ncbi:MAG TPA: tetratricopeptide repeat protein [Candidatus Omnitrophota bacterium]|nr:tetratricopeptide repeat protein [Candidatus Omnitrophota bacterium]
MKIRMRLFFVFIILSACVAVNLFAGGGPQEELLGRLKAAYDSYPQDQAGACARVEDILQSEDVAVLDMPETKAAWTFLANCHYQLKNMDKAVRFYDEVAALDPGDHQALVNAGHVYAQQGLYGQAEKKYREALRRVDGDEAEEKKVRAMIMNIPGRIQKNYRFSTSLGYDSNVNSGPSDTTHFLYGAYNYTLDSDAKPRDDFYYYHSLSAVFSKKVDQETNVLLNVGANNISYFKEDDFNSSVFSLSLGFKKLSGGKSMTITPYVNYQILDDRSYQVNSGLNLSGAVRVSETMNVWPYVGGYTQDFYKNDPRDAVGGSAGASLSYQVGEKTSWTGSLFFTHHHADNDRFTYNNVFLGSSFRHNISKAWAATAGYNLQLFYYDDMDPVFGTARKDNGHKYYLACDYSLEEMLRMDKTFVSVSLSYFDNNSNHSFQERERFFSSVTLTFNF